MATQKIADAPGRKHWTTFELIAKLKKAKLRPLGRMKKDELLALAQEMGLAVSKKMTVAVLRTLIAQALNQWSDTQGGTQGMGLL